MKTIIFSLLFISFIFADLPSHCLNSQIKGNWNFQLTQPKYMKMPFENNCGHNIPDSTRTSYYSLKDNSLSFPDSLELELKVDGLVKGIGSNENQEGKWTMVYDEGFEITFDSKTFFAFSYFEPDQNSAEKFEIDCTKTLVGWYQLDTGTIYGCFKGIKQDKSLKTEKVIVSQEKVYHGRKETQDKIFLGSFHRFRFLSKYSSSLLMRSTFKDHNIILDRLNNIQNLKWKAGLSNEFSQLSISELNILAGRKKYSPINSKKDYRFIEKKNILSEDVRDLPKSFDWGNMIRGAATQSTCGSCYTISTLRMIEARLKIRYNQDVYLSAQHVIDCSFYNQGCDGGYPFLVGKFGSDFYYIPETCKVYSAKQGKCHETCNFSGSEYLVKANNYYYVGGRYGMATERLIMEEVKNHGPVVISFEPDYLFMMYQKGIYHGISENAWLNHNEERPEWTKVDHSTLLYGWGEDNGEKFWLLQNSWGNSWGENGNFKIRRGSNEMGVESAVEAIDPILITNKEIISNIYDYTVKEKEAFVNNEK